MGFPNSGAMLRLQWTRSKFRRQPRKFTPCDRTARRSSTTAAGRTQDERNSLLVCPIPGMSYKRTANLAISKDKSRSCKLRWDSLLQFCSPRSAWPRRSSVIPPARIIFPLFHAQITFDTITRERVAARVSARSADVQYLDVKPALAITNIAEMAFSIEK